MAPEREAPEAAGATPRAWSERGAALSEALDAVGDRWKLLIVAALLDGPRRFGDLEAALGGIAPNVLSARLRALEADGLVVARPYQDRPPRYTYELTETARGLAGPLDSLARWAAGDDPGAAPVHGDCGTPLAPGWYCPTCERPVPDGEAEELDYA